MTFEDVPARPGTAQEHGGIIKHGAKLLYAFAEATVPKLTVITRKAYGGAYCVMASKHIRADANFAFPHRRDRSDGARGGRQHPLPPRAGGDGRSARFRASASLEFREKFANPYVAAERGYVDDVIEPRETASPAHLRARDPLYEARPEPSRKHGNLPL